MLVFGIVAGLIVGWIVLSVYCAMILNSRAEREAERLLLDTDEVEI